MYLNKKGPTSKVIFSQRIILRTQYRKRNEDKQRLILIYSVIMTFILTWNRMDNWWHNESKLLAMKETSMQHFRTFHKSKGSMEHHLWPLRILWEYAYQVTNVGRDLTYHKQVEENTTRLMLLRWKTRSKFPNSRITAISKNRHMT